MAQGGTGRVCVCVCVCVWVCARGAGGREWRWGRWGGNSKGDRKGEAREEGGEPGGRMSRKPNEESVSMGEKGSLHQTVLDDGRQSTTGTHSSLGP